MNDEEILAKFPQVEGGFREPPEGFRPHLSGGEYSNHNGPFYQKLVGRENYRGFYVLERHCNSMGIAHGGVMVSFADALLGLSVFRKMREAPLTVRLTTDFLASAKLGEWVEGRGWVRSVVDGVVYAAAAS